MIKSIIKLFQENSNLRNTALAFVAIGASVGALLSLKSPSLPLFTATGATAGSAIIAGTPGSKSRKQRQLEAEIEQKYSELKSWQENLIAIQQEIQDWNFKKNDLEEELKRQAFESVVTQVQQDYSPKYQRLQEKEQALNDAIARLKQWEEQLKEQSQSVLTEAEEKVKEAWEKANEWMAEREAFYRSWTGQAINQLEQIKKPQYPTGDSREELLARDAIDGLAKLGIYAQKPYVIPSNNGFDLSFEVLPILLPQGLTRSVKEDSGKPLTLDLAVRIINDNRKGLIASIAWQLRQVKPQYPERLVMSFVHLKTAALTTDLILPPPTQRDSLFEFVNTCYQLAILGEPGTGKTVLLKNMLGLLNESLGGNSQIIVTNPKPSEGSQLPAKYKGFKRAIFGLLEAATEVAYRLSVNEKVTDGNYPKHEPLIYVFDEYTETARKWNEVSKDRFTRATEEFKSTLTPERLAVFEEDVLSFIDSKKFAGSLLQFTWNVGRSERVKTVIAGQKLMPNTLDCNIQDLNCLAWICLGDSIEWAKDNLIYSFQKAEISKEQKHLIESERKFYGLYVPSGKRAYFADLPPENTYPCPTNFCQFESCQTVISSETEDSYSDDFDDSTGFDDSQNLPTSKKDDNHRLSSEITPSATLPVEAECDPLLTTPPTYPNASTDNTLEPWNRLANPQKLFDSAESRIIGLINEGKLDAFSIAKSIWGDVVKANAKPYAGKNGVKQLIEKLLESSRN